MAWHTYAARRTGFAVLSAFLVVSLTFLVVKTAPNTDLSALLYGAGSRDTPEAQRIIEEYRKAHGTTGTLLEQYVRYMADVAVLDWGYSYEFNRPVEAILAEALPRTLAYLIPGVLFAYATGVLSGLASAYGDTRQDAAIRFAAYVALGVPSMVLGAAVVAVLTPYLDWLAPPVWQTIPFMARGRPSFRGTEPWVALGPKYLLPSAVLAVGLIAGLYRHTRNNALFFRSSPVTKMLDAKGATTLMSARHALRNAALPLLSVSFAELMSVLALGSFVVETVFRIPGLAAYTQVAVYTRDFRLIVGATAVYAFIGIVGSLLQDLLYAYLDPHAQ